MRGSFPGLSSNIDLLIGLPGQTAASVATDLEAVRRWRCNSVDVLYYVMMPGTQRDLTQSGQRVEPSVGDQLLRLREIVNTVLDGNSWQPLTGEVFASSNRDLFTRTSFGGGGHCLNTLLAMGPSAFGLLGTTAYQNVCDLAGYLARVDAGKFPVVRARMLSEATARRALILSILRLSIPKALLRGRRVERLCERWQRAGLVTDAGATFNLTDTGRLWYNHMQMEVPPWTELVGSLPMFGASPEFAQRRSGGSAPYLDALNSVVRGSGVMAPGEKRRVQNLHCGAHDSADQPDGGWLHGPGRGAGSPWYLPAGDPWAARTRTSTPGSVSVTGAFNLPRSAINSEIEKTSSGRRSPAGKSLVRTRSTPAATIQAPASMA